MTSQRAASEKEDYLRLVAFWVICEAFAGGIIHAIKLPFSGMIISSLAVFCIVMIGRHFPKRGNIIKATVLVCIFKLMLSPHSPPTAYIAVLFQGIMGEVLFRLKLRLTVTATLLAVLALVESACQRILVLWILYGNEFWDAVDKYIEKFSGTSSTGSIPGRIALGYICLHAVVGFAAGLYISVLAKRTREGSVDVPPGIKPIHDLPAKKKKRARFKSLFILSWLALAAILFYGYAFPSNAIITAGSAWWLVFRAATIALGWYFIVSPLLMAWFRKKMEASKNRNLENFRIIHSLLPTTRQIFMDSWSASSGRKGLMRLHEFLKLLAANMVPRR